MLQKKVVDALSEPFDKKFIKQRDGAFGRTLDYIEAHIIIQRLNDVFGANWNFEVLTKPNESIINGHLVVQVRLTVPNIDADGKIIGWVVKEQVGGKKITVMKVDKSILDLASDFKAATTDALKKAATLLGVGLDLYGSDEKEVKIDAEPAEDIQKAASSIQINAINRIASSKKIQDLDKFIKGIVGDAYNKIDDLTESQAKKVITALNSYESK